MKYMTKPLLDGSWMVAEPTKCRPLSEDLTEAEARVIAFALNAINRGHELFEKDIAHNAEFRYDGPTEGV